MSICKYKKTVILVGISIIFTVLILTIAEAKTNEEIYQEKLDQLKPDDVEGYYKLGLWCQQNKLSEQAKTQFEKVLELDHNHTGAHQKLGHIKYKDKWQTPDELKAQGLVEYKGKWIPYDEKMKAEGYVKFEEQWITLKERDLVIKLTKLYLWKGAIDLPGADSENLPWEKAREKKTEHFIVKTNLSADALNDVCFLLEYAYFVWYDFYKFSESKEKTNVLVPKNRGEFEKILNDLVGVKPSPQQYGIFIPKDDRRNKSQKDHLLTYYYLEELNKPTDTLLHEGTHYAVELARRACEQKMRSSVYQPPQFLNEGLACCFESSKVEGKKLLTNLINQLRLPKIKDAINNNTYINLKEFINLPLSKYRLTCYDEGWSLIYFLVNAKEGKYKKGLSAYIEAWKEKRIDLTCDGKDVWVRDNGRHIKVFEQCMGVPIDQMEKEWKEYILQLK